MTNTTGVKPHYLSLETGQLRLWQIGKGPDLVALAGPTLSAEPLAERLHRSLGGYRVTVFELPGIGGSATLAADSLDGVATSLAAGLSALGYRSFALAAFELATAVLPILQQKLVRRPVRTVAIGASRAQAWADRRLLPPSLEPRQDGTHLTALWHHLRDSHLLVPSDPSQPATDGEPLPGVAELDAGFVASAVAPRKFAGVWEMLIDGMAGLDASAEVVHVAALDGLQGALGGLSLEPSDMPLPKTVALPGDVIWYDYVETHRGRVHLRRAGGLGPPLLLLPTGGGSSEQFSPVVRTLSKGRQAFSIDYFGNGLSDRLDRDVTVAMLAEDAAAVIQALGFETIDIWGSHTGSLVGLELAILYPQLVRRAVLEGPVFISPDFQSDLLDNYFPPIRADKWGMHIPLIWNWRRDMFMYWPWYKVDRSVARQLGVPSAEQLHLYAIGILESGSTYDQAYRSAFKYDTASRLPLLKRPALICAGPNDMLVNGVEEAEKFAVPGVETRLTPTTVWWPDPDAALAAETYAVYEEFFNR
ncbi:alpha/beta hydrolase [Rhizobium sp. CFBP 8752]|uniref:alpha/beta hydrolase n=1 Tax=Rhizobium sp. CFBP 8752 TaxID=2775301 RepID=UPI00177B0359|nr:alpha/beta hydrolase [Rhizobium sp. CFBP 8752]MBD8664225.1 alpha/beta hydrolase [Rhizobium sp. CFBP 8752]